MFLVLSSQKSWKIDKIVTTLEMRKFREASHLPQVIHLGIILAQMWTQVGVVGSPLWDPCIVYLPWAPQGHKSWSLSLVQTEAPKMVSEPRCVLSKYLQNEISRVIGKKACGDTGNGVRNIFLLRYNLQKVSSGFLFCLWAKCICVLLLCNKWLQTAVKARHLLLLGFCWFGVWA